jgi:hypothetical protein
MRRRGDKIPSLRLNLVIYGELAQWVTEIKERGLARTNREIIVWALRVLRERIVHQDLEEARLRTLSRAEGGS